MSLKPWRHFKSRHPLSLYVRLVHISTTKIDDLRQTLRASQTVTNLYFLGIVTALKGGSVETTIAHQRQLKKPSILDVVQNFAWKNTFCNFICSVYCCQKCWRMIYLFQISFFENTFFPFYKRGYLRGKMFLVETAYLLHFGNCMEQLLEQFEKAVNSFYKISKVRQR